MKSTLILLACILVGSALDSANAQISCASDDGAVYRDSSCTDGKGIQAAPDARSELPREPDFK